jgi:hypothetical protein
MGKKEVLMNVPAIMDGFSRAVAKKFFRARA